MFGKTTVTFFCRKSLIKYIEMTEANMLARPVLDILFF